MSFETMLGAARAFPQHLRDGASAAEAAPLPDGEPDAILFCGMGGSAIGGTLTAQLLAGAASVPLVVCRDHHVPGFVDEGTVVIATSYSGNTQETLDAVREALDRGARLAAITTGGKLKALAEVAGAPVVPAPEGFQPRAALGYLFGANLTLASRILDEPHGGLAEVASHLEGELARLTGDEGTAAAIAADIGEGPVGVVAHDALGVVAERWAGQINENAKRVAFHATLPEMAHNQLVGWAGEPAGASLVLLRREREGKLESVRFDHLAERAAKAGARVLEVRLDGDGLGQVLQGVLVGDLVSLYMARAAGLDPEPVEVITELKRRFER